VIVIATSEPDAGYHLAPLARQAVEAFGADGVMHLTDAEMPLHPGHGQRASVPATADMSVLDGAKLLVLAGSAVTSWTEQVAAHADRQGVPVVFSELALLNRSPRVHRLPPLAGATAGSAASRARLAEHLQISPSRIVVTGYPFLDALSGKENPIRNGGTAIRVLAVPSAHEEYDELLMQAATSAVAAGMAVQVRPHPRVPRDWSPLTVNVTAALRDAILWADVVLTVSGSAALAAAAQRVPAVYPLDAIGQVPAELLAIGHVATLEGVAQALLGAFQLPADVATHVCGPIGGAGQSVVNCWKMYAAIR
jgi:hypothetical protein